MALYWCNKNVTSEYSLTQIIGGPEAIRRLKKSLLSRIATIILDMIHLQI